MSLELDAEGLRAAARRLTVVGEETDAELARLQRGLDAMGQPWGDDDLGTAIGTIYHGAMAMVLNCCTSNLDTVDGYSELICAAADGFEAGERDRASQLAEVGPGSFGV